MTVKYSLQKENAIHEDSLSVFSITVSCPKYVYHLVASSKLDKPQRNQKQRIFQLHNGKIYIHNVFHLHSEKRK